MTTLFPSGIATGNAFYDRKNERKQLTSNIDHTRHTVLIAPRRFGKTSLMRRVLEETGYSYIWMDFMTTTSKEEAQLKILNRVSELVIALGKTEAKIKLLLKKFLSVLQPEITVGMSSALKISFRPNFTLQDNLITALEGVDAMAKESKKRIVIIFDEFQEIINIDENATLQASIRHAAEKAQYVTYLFSGSKHRPLRNLFNGKKNPLYELCEQMTINRIDESYYQSYLQEQAKIRWGYELNETILNKIFNYTECYPKYINAICARLWMHESIPTEELIDKLWEDYMFSRRGGIHEELTGLKMNERKLLQHLCFNPTSEPFSASFLSSVNLSQASMQRALEELQNKDLVVEIEDEFRIIDPTYKYYFQKF